MLRERCLLTNDKPYRLSNLEQLLGRPIHTSEPTEQEAQQLEKAEKFSELLQIRRSYKWEWNAGAKFLFSELIRTYGLDGEWREKLMELSKAKPGRKRDAETAVQIALLHLRGMTAKQISEHLGSNGKKISVEGVESYLKSRRKRSLEERVKFTLRKNRRDV